MKKKRKWKLQDDELKKTVGGIAYDPFEKLSGSTSQDTSTSKRQISSIYGIEQMGPSDTSISLDSDSRPKKLD